MALKDLAPMFDSDDAETAAERLKQAFLDFQQTHSLTGFSLTGEYRMVRRDELATIVAMVRLDGLNELYEYLRATFAVEFPTQPAHITLYTYGRDRGIPILSSEELSATEIVNIPGLKNLKTKVKT